MTKKITSKLLKYFLAMMLLSLQFSKIYSQGNPAGLNGTTNDGSSNSNGNSGSSGNGSGSNNTGNSNNSSNSQSNGKNKGLQNFNGGSGAPIDGGASILILATAAYTGRKLAKIKQKKEEKPKIV